MRIGIDIRSLQNDSQNRGIGTYTRCLIKSLLSVDKENEYVFFVFKNRPLPYFLREHIFKKIKLKPVTSRRKRFVWLSGQTCFPFAIAKEKLDIFHSPEYIVPVFSRAKKIITVHDFINNDYQLYRKRSGLIRRIYFYLKDRTLKYADRIIAVSEYTKQKITELVGIGKDVIKVIYQAADDAFVPQDDEDFFIKLKEKYGINKDFLLYVGAVDYHKNIDSLIKAFGQVHYKDINLVLAGIKNDLGYLAFINRLIERLRLKNRVYILGYVPTEDLIGLYNASKVTISVSVYEGFGLPVLEAMSCGKPVIAAGNTSMREIVNSSGLLVDPYNIEEITSAIENLLSDEKLRRALSEKALKRSREFSWKKAAEETISLYKELLHN